MRVLHVNDHLSPMGGIETYLLSLVPLLHDAGFTQGIAFGKGDSSLAAHAFEIPELRQPGWGSAHVVRAKLTKVLEHFKPDLIHLHNIHNVDAVEFLLDRKPVVLTCHDFRYLCPASNFYLQATESVCNRRCSLACFGITLRNKCMTLRPSYSWKYYQRVVRVRRRFSEFRQLIAPGRDAADRFVEAGFPLDKVSVLPYFCRIPPATSPRFAPREPLILYLGRLTRNKGWHYFVEALGKLSDDVKGLVVGNVEAVGEQTLRGVAEQYGCTDRLSWQAWATEEQITDILMKTSAVIFPSLWPETLGIVGLEAMAHGVPVVGSRIGGVTEWLVDGENGYLVEPGNADAIACAVRKIITDEENARRMGVNALNRVRAKFLPESHLERLLEIYQGAI